MKVPLVLVLILTGLILFSCTLATIETPTPASTPIPLPVPRQNSLLTLIPPPPGSGNALIKIDPGIKGETILAKAEFLAEEINKQGYLIFRIDAVSYDEEKGAMTFLVKFFCSYSIDFYDIQGGLFAPNYAPNKNSTYLGIPPPNFSLPIVVSESIFHYISQMISPIKIDVVFSFPNGIIVVYRAPFDSDGKRIGNPSISVSPNLLPFSKDKNSMPYLNLYPIPLSMYGVSVSLEELISVRNVQGTEPEEKMISLAEELNKQGEYNFRVTIAEYKPAENQIFFTVMFYFSGVLDKNSNSINYNFKPENREEFNYFTARVLGSIFVHAARLADFDAIVISVFGADGAVSGYIAKGKDAMGGLRNSGGIGWQEFVAGYDIGLVYPILEVEESSEQEQR